MGDIVVWFSLTPSMIFSVGNTGLYLSLIGGFILEAYGLKVVVRGGGFLIFIGIHKLSQIQFR